MDSNEAVVISRSPDQLLPLPPNASRTAKMLAQMPKIRNMKLRETRANWPNWARKSNVEAGLAQERGAIAQTACSSCRTKTKGAFDSCVVVKGFFNGSCANCQVNSLYTTCSFYGRIVSVIWIPKLV
jgi:hypothetical protein